MSTLNRALEIAALALAGKVDKNGEPLIFHVYRVVQAMDRYFSARPERDEARIVAALHDVLEDAPERFGRYPRRRLIAEGFSRSVCDAVVALTRGEGEEYLSAYIARVIAGGRSARAVKHADLTDNMSRQIAGESEADMRCRLRRYERARWIVADAMIQVGDQIPGSMGVFEYKDEPAGAAQGEGRPL